MSSFKEICIIGCGIAGISALRVFSEEIIGLPQNYSIQAYERRSNLGGLWNYDENLDAEFVSPVYRDLKTNLPKELMAYPDFPFSDDLENSVVGHRDVLNYIQSYVKHFDLEKYIEYNSEILKVEPISNPDFTRWKLTILNLKTSTKLEKWFDVVLVCNGHFDTPKIPNIKGIEDFRGECIHSINYRVPEKFMNKTVFVVGASYSGMDIALQLLNGSKKVYLSHSGRKLMWKSAKNNFLETVRISHIDCDGMICLVDGSRYEADVIMFCTGYEINLDILSENVGLSYDNTFVRPLYKHLINPYFPDTLFVIGIGYLITPFNHSYMQCKVVRSIIQNCYRNLDLSTEWLIQEIEQDDKVFEINNIQMRHRHYFNEKEWPYFEWCEHVAHDVMTYKMPYYLKYISAIARKWIFKSASQYRDISIKLSTNNKLGFEIKEGPDNDFYSEDFMEMLSLVP